MFKPTPLSTTPWIKASPEETPIRLLHVTLCLCQQGEAELEIDNTIYCITSQDLVVSFPQLVQVIRRSDDFRAIEIEVDVDFFATIQIADKPSYFLFIKSNPCITLSSSERAKIVSLCSLYEAGRAQPAHPFRKEIDESMLQIISYETAAIYLKRKPKVLEANSRSEEIFQRFIFLLFEEVPCNRSLSFYADKLAITPRHLSLVVKSVSGQTAGQWIVSYVISHLKQLLRNENCSIQQITEDMGFPNPSFLAQYFKKQVGVSPKYYRANFRKTLSKRA